MAYMLTDRCPKCGQGYLELKRRREDGHEFLGCSRYPECRERFDYKEGLQEFALDQRRNAWQEFEAIYHTGGEMPAAKPDIDWKLELDTLVGMCDPLNWSGTSADREKIVTHLYYLLDKLNGVGW